MTVSKGIAGGIMVPHPPIILKNIGRGEEKKIADIDAAYRLAAQSAASTCPDTVIIVSPHAPCWADYIQVSSGPSARGDMSAFGDSIDRFEIELDQPLAQEIHRLAHKSGIPTGTLGPSDSRLDHGTMVPLYYLQPLLPHVRWLRVGIGGVDQKDHYAAGMLIARAAENLGRKAVIVASGDLSHCQKEDTQYGFKDCGPQYDQKIMDIMGRSAFDELLDISEAEAEDAMVCGQKPFCVLAGALDGTRPASAALAHSAVFGVGYGVCTYENLQTDSSRHFLDLAQKKSQQRYQERICREDPYIRLARMSIENCVQDRSLSTLRDPLPQELFEDRAGAFVSIHKDGKLRGCIGTTAPTADCLAEEIMQNAVSAATRDPRFHPIEPRELWDLEISVDILKKPEPVTDLHQLDVRKYGVIVSKNGCCGLLLPDLEGIDTIEKQLSAARQKAGLACDEEDCQIERFEVVRHQITSDINEDYDV